NKILDLLISITLIYALLSLLVSILLEWWNSFKKARAKHLKASISQLLNDPMNLQFGELFYDHFLINTLRNKTKKLDPQYISSTLFAEVVIDIIGYRDCHDLPVRLLEADAEKGKQYAVQDSKVTASTVVERFRNGLDNLKPSPLTDTLHSFLMKCDNDQEKLKRMLAGWFDDYMDRVSGWFKQQQRNKLYVFGFIVAIALNVDSLHLIKMISLDDVLRNNLVASANDIANQYNTLSDSAKQKTSELEGAVTNAFPQSTLRDNNNQLTLKPLIDSLISKHDSTSIIILAKLDSLVRTDSLTAAYQRRADRILNVATSLNIPIGWNKSSAPLSWRNKHDNLTHHPEQIKVTQQNQLIDYLDKRNQYDFMNVVVYIIGIAISGFSLSFGAPFWFDTLMKLVNIRRAGKKPEVVNVTKK
ncbi:MAG TPA: hypothetical protein VIM65_20840, partial [Cyclobacteriaceae bacterium]